MTQSVAKPRQGDQIGEVRGNAVVAEDLLQNYLDEIEGILNNNLVGDAVILPVYTVAHLLAATPSAVTWTNGTVIVSDETGGRTIATSDGTNWRRVSDGAIVS